MAAEEKEAELISGLGLQDIGVQDLRGLGFRGLEFRVSVTFYGYSF